MPDFISADLCQFSDLASIRSQLERGLLAAAAGQLESVIRHSPLNQEAFVLLAELQAARGDSGAAAVALRRAAQLRQIERAAKPAAAVERLRALQAQAEAKQGAAAGKGACLELAEHCFAGLRLHRAGERICLVGASTDGSAFLQVEWAAPASASGRFAASWAIERELTAAGCLSHADLLDSGFLRGGAILPLLAAGVAGQLALENREPDSTEIQQREFPYRISRYARADRGGFGIADILLSLLEHQAFGIYPNRLGVEQLRFDSLTGICRFTDYRFAVRLGAAERALPPQDFLQWCLARERERCAKGDLPGEPPFIAGLQVPKQLFEGGKLELINCPLFARQRIVDLPEPSIQAVATERLSLMGPIDVAGRQKVMEGLAFAAGERVLDIGSGFGAVARALAAQGCLVSGVDCDGQLVRGARIIASIERLPAGSANFHEMDAGQRLPPGRFDTVLLLGVLHHIAEPAALARRIAEAGVRRIVVENRLREFGYQWIGRWYQPVEYKWDFADSAQLLAHLRQLFPDFEEDGSPYPTTAEQFRVVLLRKDGASAARQGNACSHSPGREAVLPDKAKVAVAVPASPSAAYKQGLKYFHAGDVAKMLSFCPAAAARFPKSADLLGLAINAYIQANNPLAAVRLGASFLARQSEEEKVVGWLELIIEKVTTPERDILESLRALRSARGRALLVRALVAARCGVEALAAYQNLLAAHLHQELLPAVKFMDLLFQARLFEQAEQAAWLAITPDPRAAYPLCRMVQILTELANNGQPERFPEAKQLAELFYQQKPDNPMAAFAMALVWRAAARPDQAQPYLRHFMQAMPEHPFGAALVFESNYEDELSQPQRMAEHKVWAATFARLVRVDVPPPRLNISADRPLRIGYVSPDFGIHAVGFFAHAVIPEHDRRKVEVFLYAERDSASEDDVLCRSFRACVGEDHWRWTKGLPPGEVVRTIQADGIDVLVDLAGYTRCSRLDFFTNRSAPVQVTWLGYPNSTCIPNMDYRISDDIVEPVGDADAWSSEEIVRLPNGFHAIRYDPDIPEPAEPPCLKNGYLTFGSFNNVNKLSPATLRLWGRVLQEIPSAVLLLKHKMLMVFENREGIRSLFAAMGVDPARIRFRGVTKGRVEHFLQYAHVDVALDPLTYNGTTTTCDALYMGVPVLTLPGVAHASRVSASLLHRVGMDGWVARDEAHFLRIARAAAANPAALAARRARLRSDFLSSPLSNGAGLAADLETAYRQMWHRACLRQGVSFHPQTTKKT